MNMNKPIFFILLLDIVILMAWPSVASGQDAWAGTEDSKAFERLVDSLGLAIDAVDLSQADMIIIDEPRLCYVNLTGFEKMPTIKEETRKGWMEFYDGAGHYMLRPVTLSGQGGYSIKFPKRNFVCHFTDDEWNEDNGPDITIGEWVDQDSFHFKAFWTDFMRGTPEVAYKLFHQMRADRQPYWEQGGYYSASRARCYPDGFPCAVYLNGSFYGIYAWQLKKHRKNMNQKKLLSTHIHLDGNICDEYLFAGNIDWSQFEVRNPKQLVTVGGTAYDGNTPTDIISEDSPYYELPNDDVTTRQDKQRTAEVRQAIVNMSCYCSELAAMEQANASAEKMRRQIANRYDTEALIDYYVFYYFSQNGDGNHKNWQWFTYDGCRWAVTPYDLDQTFGLGLYGGNVRPPYASIPKLTQGPFRYIEKYFYDDICDRYAKMRDNGIFACDNIAALADDWYDRVGTDMYDLEKQRWPESPCYCEPICGEGWEPLDDWHLTAGAQEWSVETAYTEGDVCWFEGRPWVATAATQGVTPAVRNSIIDTIDRLHDWIEGRIEFLDDMFAYEPLYTYVGSTTERRRPVAFCTLDGRLMNRPEAGKVCIVRYSDGTVRKMLMK